MLFTGLPGAVVARDAATISPVELGPLLQWASNERLAGLLSWAVGCGELVIDGGDDEGAQVAEALHRALRSSLAAEATAVVAVTELRRRLHRGGRVQRHGQRTSRLSESDAKELLRRGPHRQTPGLRARRETMLDSGFERTNVPLGRRWERRFARRLPSCDRPMVSRSTSTQRWPRATSVSSSTTSPCNPTSRISARGRRVSCIG